MPHTRHGAGFCLGVVLLLLLTLGPLLIHAAEPVRRLTTFCATCKIWGADSFVGESGQFIVHGNSIPRSTPLTPGTNDEVFVQLEPQFAAVTAERTKRAFLQELGAKDAYRDKIHIIVLDRAREDQLINIVSEVHPDRFEYRVALPGRIEVTQLVKGLLQVIMLEQANRGARRCAELPSWLVEGMTRQLLTSFSPAYVLNRKPLTIETSGYDRLKSTRALLQTNSLMTIQELSFSNLAALNEQERTRYEASAHLLVHQLLRLRHGPALMARFIQALPHTLNWQTAMLAVYREHFSTALELEKWWTLSWLEFRHRQDRQTWPAPFALQRLESLLLIPMEVRVDSSSIPEARDVPLQKVLSSTSFATHRQLLSHKLQQLSFLSLNAPADVLPLWNAYVQALETYLDRQADDRPSLKIDPEQRRQSIIRDATRLLDELDFARAELRAGRKVPLPREVARR